MGVRWPKVMVSRTRATPDDRLVMVGAEIEFEVADGQDAANAVKRVLQSVHRFGPFPQGGPEEQIAVGDIADPFILLILF